MHKSNNEPVGTAEQSKSPTPADLSSNNFMNLLSILTNLWSISYIRKTVITNEKLFI